MIKNNSLFIFFFILFFPQIAWSMKEIAEEKKLEEKEKQWSPWVNEIMASSDKRRFLDNHLDLLISSNPEHNERFGVYQYITLLETEDNRFTISQGETLDLRSALPLGSSAKIIDNILIKIKDASPEKPLKKPEISSEEYEFDLDTLTAQQKKKYDEWYDMVKEVSNVGVYDKKYEESKNKNARRKFLATKKIAFSKKEITQEQYWVYEYATLMYNQDPEAFNIGKKIDEKLELPDNTTLTIMHHIREKLKGRKVPPLHHKFPILPSTDS